MHPLARRRFLKTTAAGCLAFSLPRIRAAGESTGEESFDVLSRDLLRDWCDAMLALQIHDPSDPTKHGALSCPACDFIHGRCMDAVYPFLHVAKVTGMAKYVDAAKMVMEWSKNMTQDDGSWTVVADPKSWKGITVFGAIALGEALHQHGDLLDEETKRRWMERLGRAGDYIFKNFTSLDFSNINYGCTGIYAMDLLGKLLERPAYLERSRSLSSGIKDFLTKPNGLLFGEGKPPTGTSPRGCRPVDLGYNVEETIVSLSLAADSAGDAEFKNMVGKLLAAHLEFMLPDGAWDNSWGTRHAKWTYWGSRTCDGCQHGYAVMAEAYPVFATAVVENTRLFRRCTSKGLLHGGPHYAIRGVKPCVHHTFTHAKVLASLRDHGDLARRIKAKAALPRAVADGIREYPETLVWLAARGPWRATVTANDWIYQKETRQPSGGVISMLWHPLAGPLFAGSMTRYHLVEKNNMQANPEAEDHPLTPRVELREKDAWFTQLYDLAAKVAHSDKDGVLGFTIDTSLLDEQGHKPSQGDAACSLTYRIDVDWLVITVNAPAVGSAENRPRLVLPVISPSDEKVTRTDHLIEIQKPGCKVIIESATPLRIDDCPRGRIFNLVPGFEAIPIFADVPVASPLECRLRVIPA